MMGAKNSEPPAADQVELIIRRLDSLSTLPCVATRLLCEVLHLQGGQSDLAEIIESEPALTANILSLMHRQGLSTTEAGYSVRGLLDKLGPEVVRDAFLSVRVLYPFDNGFSDTRTAMRKQLIKHSVAVARCAREISETTPLEMDSNLAFTAGLLHDIGKLAIEETMPKSFARIVEEARSQKVSTRGIEQEHLGLDHTTIGKRLAQKWHLPEQVGVAIWLHHSDTAAISQGMPEARVAQVVQLADFVARQCGIGESGSYDPPDRTEQVGQSLSISAEQLARIRQRLANQVQEKSEALGLELPNALAAYGEIVRTAAVRFAKDSSKLSLENRRLQTTSSHFEFIRDFLLSIDSSMEPIDAAEDFAVRWQRFYQTGMVCLYFVPPAGSKTLEAVLVQNLAQTKHVVLAVPEDLRAIPAPAANKFVILNAEDHTGWLFEQLEAEFDVGQTRLMPLLCDGRAIGAIVFELRYPGDMELFTEQFRASTSIAASVLAMALKCRNQQRYAEQFVRLINFNEAEPAPPQEVPAGSLSDSLAEIAGGAAHELNNPLSVISGRAQLLAQSETDPEKERMLRQIKESSGEISGLINDLMTFARPTSPRASRTDIRQMLDEAIQLTSQKANAEHINVQIKVADGLESVFVDSGQIVSAIANVVCNALESYEDKLGPVKVTADAADSGRFVRLQISDLGCGMDAETVGKATQPFFSGKAAGRKRGMGLAHAKRLIELNNGSLTIESTPDSGTTVTISLPVKSEP